MSLPSPSFRPSLSMLGWALDEEENIAAYVDRAHALLRSVSDDFELIVIDDGSTDRTWEILTACAAERPWLRPIRNGRNRGSGYNTKLAISLATRDYLFWQTVDWSYDITLLASSLPLLAECDVLQGVRLDAMSLRTFWRQRSDTSQKAIISLVNYWLIRLLFGLPLHDFQNVTVYPRRLIQSISLESESAFTNPECLLKAWWRGARIQEVPVPFLKRQKGVAKGTRPRAVLAAVSDVLRWWLRWVALSPRSRRGRGAVRYWPPTAAGASAR